MKISPTQWPQLTVADLQHLNAATEPIHVAAQLISMAGKFFLPHQSDDSHTNMGWDVDQKYLIGHPLPTSVPLRLALQPASMKLLIIYSEDQVVEELSLGGKTLEEAVAWVKRELTGHWFGTDSYRIDLHYDMPAYSLLRGGTFAAPEGAGYVAFGKARELGQQVMEAYAAEFAHASPVRTWPHHFDMGTYVPIRLDESGGVVNSLTMGLAIADSEVDEYFFYLTSWSREGKYATEPLSELPSGGCWGLKDDAGAVLKLSEVVRHPSAEAQMQAISTFLEAAIGASLKRIGEGYH